MDKAILDADEILQHASPIVHQAAHEVQPYGHLIRMPIALAESACKKSVENLNQLLADSMTLRDLYKKHHWHVSGPTFYQLHLLFDKHCAEQTKLIDSDRGTHSVARRREHRDGARCGRDNHHSEISQGP